VTSNSSTAIRHTMASHHMAAAMRCMLHSWQGLKDRLPMASSAACFLTHLSLHTPPHTHLLLTHPLQMAIVLSLESAACFLTHPSSHNPHTLLLTHTSSPPPCRWRLCSAWSLPPAF
jgi:hypothetical protein